MSVEYEDAGYIVASEYRQHVLRYLADGAGTPSSIAEATPLSIAHVSRALQELRDEDYVELLVPEERKKGRIYGITEKGRDAADAVAEMNGGESA